MITFTLHNQGVFNASLLLRSPNWNVGFLQFIFKALQGPASFIPVFSNIQTQVAAIYVERGGHVPLKSCKQ